MVRNILVNGVSLAVGLIVGALMFRAPASGLEVNNPSAHASAPAPAALDAGQVRTLLREELGAALTSALAAAGGNGRSATASTQVAVQAVTASPQQQREALQLANDIIAGGQWGDGERISFHQQLAQLDPAQREQAMQNLVQAIDNGSLNVSTQGPPI